MMTRHWNGTNSQVILLNLVCLFYILISNLLINILFVTLGMVSKEGTFIDAIKNYYSSEIKDTGLPHDTEVENMVYIDKLKHLLVMERDAKRFKVYDTKSGKWWKTIPEKNVHSGGAIIAGDYVEYENVKLVATTSNNNSIRFWDHNSYIAKENLNTSSIQMCIKWCGHGIDRLFTGSTDYQLHAFDVRGTMKEISKKESKKDEDNLMNKSNICHTKPILDLLPIPDMQYIATASLDSNMCLWNMQTLQGVSIHTDHSKGIYSLEW